MGLCFSRPSLRQYSALPSCRRPSGHLVQFPLCLPLCTAVRVKSLQRDHHAPRAPLHLLSPSVPLSVPPLHRHFVLVVTSPCHADPRPLTRSHSEMQEQLVSVCMCPVNPSRISRCCSARSSIALHPYRNRARDCETIKVSEIGSTVSLRALTLCRANNSLPLAKPVSNYQP